jgi:hypothetical protein
MTPVETLIFLLTLGVAGVAGYVFWRATASCSRWARALSVALVALVVMGAAFGDHLAGHIYFARACKGAGVHIYRVADDVAGFRWQHADAGTPRRMGYRFIEQGETRDKVTRFTADAGGDREERDVVGIARYAFESRPQQELRLNVFRIGPVIVDQHSGDYLAEHVAFGYRGGWLFRPLVAGFGGVTATCGDAPLDYETFIKSVLTRPKV